MRALIALLAMPVMGVLAQESVSDINQQAQTLYRTVGGYGCAACHGKFAEGGNSAGGPIRGASLAELEEAFIQQPTMQKLGDSLSAEQKQTLANYLESLGKLQLVYWQVGNEQAIDTHTINANQPTQLVIYNGNFEQLNINLTLLGIEKTLTIDPLDTQAITWAPSAGNYTLNTFNQPLLIEAK